MRIITGTARGCKLFTLEGENTRPTSERAKEAVFSMIQAEIRDKTVLDLFAGSGQMSLEALSRGAAVAVLMDKSPEAVEIIRKNAAKTRLDDKCRILRGDTVALLRREAGKKYGLVFADPPYALGLIPQCLVLLHSGNLLEKDALLVCESADHGDVFGENTALNDCYDIVKTAKYGIACITLLRYKG